MKKASGGRPRKFNEPSRPVTVTLPESTLRKLALVDGDRACAIVRAADRAISDEEAVERSVHVVEVFKGKGLITIPVCPALDGIAWLRRVRMAPGRDLLALPTGTPIESLELAIVDILDHGEGLSADDADVLRALRKLLATLRRERRMERGELIFVNMTKC